MGKVCIFATEKIISDMSTYAITVNERTTSGKALMAYLQALGILIKKISPIAKNENRITPALNLRMKKAREEFAKGETISCSTPDEMQNYFDSL